MATQLAQQLNIPVDDIDSADADNPQLCAEYVKDIYQYMKELEVIHLCSRYLKSDDYVFVLYYRKSIMSHLPTWCNNHRSIPG